MPVIMPVFQSTASGPETLMFSARQLCSSKTYLKALKDFVTLRRSYRETIELSVSWNAIIDGRFNAISMSFCCMIACHCHHVMFVDKVTNATLSASISKHLMNHETFVNFHFLSTSSETYLLRI